MVKTTIIFMGKGQSKTKDEGRGRRETVSGGISPSASLSSIAPPKRGRSRKNTVTGSESSGKDSPSTEKKEKKSGSKKENKTSKSAKNTENKNDFSRKALEALFDSYAEENKTEIGVDGIIQFCSDIGVELEDPVLLVISWILSAKEQGKFTREEFVEGFQSRKVDSIVKIKCKLPEWRAEMNSDPNTFKEIYKYSFTFYTGGGKHLDLETCSELLSLLTGSLYSHTPLFCEFLMQQKSYKSLNSDQWLSYLEFCKTVGASEDNFPNYDVNDPWPVMLDEYVSWCRENNKTKQKEEEKESGEEE